tara:strand:- start:40 stop:702 length:663 start_codon:yes stop_codon:yes gene_type:complete
MKNLFYVFFAILLFSCSQPKDSAPHTKTINKTEPISKTEGENCVFSTNLKLTQVIWSGYKTTDKIKVTGKFNRFKSAKIQKKNEFQSIQDLIEGLDFLIDVGSSSSGDEIRDNNLKDFFFNLLAKNLTITGKLEKLEKDSVSVLLKLLGQEKRFKLQALYENDMIQIKGTINILNQLGAAKAFEGISNKCYELHKGPDGVSKTWQDVDVLIKAPIIKICN